MVDNNRGARHGGGMAVSEAEREAMYRRLLAFKHDDLNDHGAWRYTKAEVVAFAASEVERYIAETAKADAARREV